MLKGLLVGAGVFLAGLVLGGFLLGQTKQVVLRPPLGSGGGPIHTAPEQFMDATFISRVDDLDGALPGLATSTAGTLTAAVLCNNSVIDVNVPNTNPITLAFPSSTAIKSVAAGGCLTGPGQYRDVILQNSSGTGSFTLAIQDQSSTMKFQLHSTTGTGNFNVGTSSITGGDLGLLRIVRTASGSQPWIYYILEVIR